MRVMPGFHLDNYTFPVSKWFLALVQVQVLSPCPLGVMGEAPVSGSIPSAVRPLPGGLAGLPPQRASPASAMPGAGEAGGHGHTRREKAFLDEPEGPPFWQLHSSLASALFSEVLEFSQLSQDSSCLVGRGHL